MRSPTHHDPTPLTAAEVRRLRTAMHTSAREVAAALAEIEPRIGRHVTPSDVADHDGVVTGHYGRPPSAEQARTATYIRQLPGWGGAAALYELQPALETTLGDVARHAVAVLHAPEPGVSRHGRPGEITVSLHPATACGATCWGVRFVGHERLWHADSVELAFACLDYDVVRPATDEQAVA